MKVQQKTLYHCILCVICLDNGSPIPYLGSLKPLQNLTSSKSLVDLAFLTVKLFYCDLLYVTVLCYNVMVLPAWNILKKISI